MIVEAKANVPNNLVRTIQEVKGLRRHMNIAMRSLKKSDSELVSQLTLLMPLIDDLYEQIRNQVIMAEFDEAELLEV
jgi:hypothetical protein